ncbi:hypothetical protein L227DRAFT_568690 [Lentinus tigrinus ALCF2SS1-6]|uniref:Uncharacterized protein n=1 Tax=Lentinus tigrinus ALCF2SS1-6 TaxID=1328759 RepID=A0A5C2RMF3_9APHY|nr:hypothetical protein L227DRAFT_568690 [Lentinus tigrinus ALCF2SS1-6]
MAVYERGKVLFHVKDTVISSTHTGDMVASIKVVECDPTTSVLLVIPAGGPEDPALHDGPVMVDYIAINNTTELKADQRTRSVELSEFPLTDHPELPPAFSLTVHLGRSVVYWAFMAAYTSAMSKFHDHQFAVEDLVNSMINEDSDDEDEDTDGNSDDMDIKAEPGADRVQSISGKLSAELLAFRVLVVAIRAEIVVLIVRRV